MLNKIDDRFHFMQRSASHIGEPSELLRASPRDAFGQIQRDAIGGTPPLVGEVMLNRWQSLDEWTRQRGNAQRVLIGFQVSKEHVRGYRCDVAGDNRNNAGRSFF